MANPTDQKLQKKHKVQIEADKRLKHMTLNKHDQKPR